MTKRLQGRSWSLVLMSIIAGSHARAATVTSSSFTLSGESPALTVSGAAGPIFAYWNPRPGSNPHIHEPGFHASFFGTAAGCEPAAINGPAGPLTARARSPFNASSRPFRPAPGATVWSPQPDPGQCPGVDPGLAGPAFIAAGGGALDLFTSVAPDGPDAGFWRPISPGGQAGKGTNAQSQGSFASWVFEPSHVLHPWDEAQPGRPLRITTDESVPAVAVDGGSEPRRPSQAHQKIELSFFNAACEAAVDEKIRCHPHIMFDIELARAEGVDWQRLPFANYAHVVVDRAQARLAIVEGPLTAAGGMTAGGRGGAGLWRSLGAATQHGPFQRQTFGAEISFEQFKAALGLIAQRLAESPDDNAPPAQMAQIFGPRWDAPQAWTINQVLIGQEVHVGGPDASGYIGGRVFNVSVGP